MMGIRGGYTLLTNGKDFHMLCIVVCICIIVYKYIQRKSASFYRSNDHHRTIVHNYITNKFKNSILLHIKIFKS